MKAFARQLALGLTIAGLVVSLPVLMLAVTLALMLLTDGTHCAPSNWPVC